MQDLDDVGRLMPSDVTTKSFPPATLKKAEVWGAVAKEFQSSAGKKVLGALGSKQVRATRLHRGLCRPVPVTRRGYCMAAEVISSVRVAGCLHEAPAGLKGWPAHVRRQGRVFKRKERQSLLPLDMHGQRRSCRSHAAVGAQPASSLI